MTGISIFSSLEAEARGWCPHPTDAEKFKCRGEHRLGVAEADLLLKVKKIRIVKI
jgi:hypothetical protein